MLQMKIDVMLVQMKELTETVVEARAERLMNEACTRENDQKMRDNMEEVRKEKRKLRSWNIIWRRRLKAGWRR